MNIFEKATIKKTRFASPRGLLTTEQLWDLPLQSKSGFDLDTVAKGVNRDLKEIAEESFVTVTDNPARDDLMLQLEIIKHVIDTIVTRNAMNADRLRKAQEKSRLTQILSQRQDQELLSMTPDQIKERIAALEA